MKKKRIVLIFGAIILTLLMISTATAVNITQTQNIKEITKKTEDKETKKEMYIDPNIKITKKDLLKLKVIAKTIKDQRYKELTKNIIQTIEKKGTLYSNDIRVILNDLNMLNTEVYSGPINGIAQCASLMVGIPGTIIGLGNWIGPGLFVAWQAYEQGNHYTKDYDKVDFTFGWQGKHITENHDGFAITFIGIWSNALFPISYYNYYCSSINILGLSQIIFINY